MIRRKAERRARQRRQRIAVAVVVVAAVAAILVVGYVKFRPGPAKPVTAASQSPSATPTRLAATQAAESPSPETTEAIETPTPSPSPSETAQAITKPHIVADYIPFGEKRREEMRAYSRRRYGDSSLALDPQVIVLHYTAGGTAEGAHGLFAADTPNAGELPGVVAHFIVDKDGTIYQELPTDLRGRHAVGLNHVSVGIEFVQDGGSGPEWADQQILHRKKQLAAGLELVAWLQKKYGIADRDVIGHASANDHRLFKDLAGKTNDHGDWLGGDTQEFRKLLRAYRGE